MRHGGEQKKLSDIEAVIEGLRAMERPFGGTDAPQGESMPLPVGVKCNVSDLTFRELAALSPEVQPAAPAAGVSDTCITEETNRQNALLARGERGGIDTLHITVWGRWRDGTYQRSRAKFEALRAQAEASRDGKATEAMPGGGTITVEAKGARCGGTHCRWVIEWEGNHVVGAGRANPSEKHPEWFVQFKSLPLMKVGHGEQWERFQCWLGRMGFCITKHVVSRVDLCADLLSGIRQFERLWKNEQYITRADCDTVYRTDRRANGLAFGNGARVMCRIYNKSLELLGSSGRRTDPAAIAKHEILQQKRWLGEGDATSRTRVEFEIKGVVLREKWNVRTMEELENALPLIARWLTSDWLRFTETPFDRQARNYSRDARTADEWRQVQDSFWGMGGWIGQPSEPIELTPREVTAPRVDKIQALVMGCLKTILACGDGCVRNVGQALDQVYGNLRDAINRGGASFLDDVYKRRQLIESSVGESWIQYLAEPPPDFMLEAT